MTTNAILNESNVQNLISRQGLMKTTILKSAECYIECSEENDFSTHRREVNWLEKIVREHNLFNTVINVMAVEALVRLLTQ